MGCCGSPFLFPQINYNQVMKHRFSIFTLILFLVISQLSALEKENIIQSVKSSDGKYTFLTAKLPGQYYENLYCQNAENPDELVLILKNPAEFAGAFSNLCYNEKNETLYFGVHNGERSVNGVQLFYGEGIYVLKKDSDGNYSSKGLRRFIKMEPWLLERAKEAYFIRLPSPDYSGFLQFLFGFADYDVEPCFVYKNLLNEEALQYLYENSLLDAIITGEKEGYYSTIEDYLFCKDEKGFATTTRAISANHSATFYREGSAFVNFHYFLAYKGQVFMMENVGSDKKIYNSNGKMIKTEWSLDYSKIYLINDSESDFSVYQPAEFNTIKTEVFEKPFPYRNDTAPAFILKNRMYLRDVNHLDFYEIDKNFGIKKCASPFEQNRMSLPVFIIIILIIPSGLLLVFYFVFRKEKTSRFVFSTEQKIRGEISSDIHDSVVQDLRAIRLDVERLKVGPESSDLQQSAVKNLTECIKKMRNICYGLNPAEIAVAALKNTDVDIISVVQTLCEQFSERTKIAFSMDCENGAEGNTACFLKREASQYISRIVMEILSNVEKHSFASSLILLVRIKEGEKESAGRYLTLMFIDDGVGCDQKALEKSEKVQNHFGLRNMKHYAKVCGAKIEFLTSSDEGMQVRLTIKLAE